MPCACWITHWLCHGARGWWGDEQWPIGLLTDVYVNAEAQAADVQAWVHWLSTAHGERGYGVQGGVN